jgi:hypothetical protein
VNKDYDRLARAVACEHCGAKKGERCRGAKPGTHVKYTHHVRRRLANQVRGGVSLNRWLKARAEGRDE